MRSRLNRKYPIKPRQKDPRDLLFRESFRAINPTPSSAVSLLEWAGPVRNQGQEGSCSGHAWSGNRVLLYNKDNANEIDKTVPIGKLNLSPQYLYYKERMLEGTTDEDAGAQIITGARVLNQFGCCLESQDPYSDTSWNVPVTSTQDTEAKIYIAGAYHRIDSLEEVKLCISSGYPVTIGFSVYESFESDYTAQTGDMLMPNTQTEQYMGGHAVLVIGFDDKKQKLAIRNSWGSEWGDNGNFFMGYKIYETPDMIMDAWMIHLGPAWKAEQPKAPEAPKPVPSKPEEPKPEAPKKPSNLVE